MNGEWAAEHSDVELLLFELASATEAGARNLLSDSSAMSHLSSTMLSAVPTWATCDDNNHCESTTSFPVQ